MTKFIILVVFLTNSLSIFAQDNVEIIAKSKFSIGDRVEVYSRALDENRVLNIYLPASYGGEVKKHYPVIYLLDGSADEDFIHLAGLVQFGSFPWINQIPESILVGIENVDRKRDFTYPTNNILDKIDFPTSGGSANFIKFIHAELQPFIQNGYRTNNSKTIIGQSLGGLLATEVLLKSPNLFDNYIIISPSLWWDDESLLHSYKLTESTPKSIYIGVGKEGQIMERVAKTLYEKIKAKKPSNYAIHFGFFEQLNHGDTLHLAAYDAFNKIFRATQNEGLVK